jgi:DNA-binding response OmpR family regulator
LRRKIEVSGIRIVTVRGLGYYLERLSDAVDASAVAIG